MVSSVNPVDFPLVSIPRAALPFLRMSIVSCDVSDGVFKYTSNALLLEIFWLELSKRRVSSNVEKGF